MKLLIIIILINFVAAGDVLSIVGGYTNSTVVSKDVPSTDWLGGIAFGIEQRYSDGVSVGLSITQRGVVYDFDEVFYIGVPGKVETLIKYLTFSYLYDFDLGKHVQTQRDLRFRIGGEAGYFIDAKFRYKYDEGGEYISITETVKENEWRDMSGNMGDYGVTFGLQYNIHSSFALGFRYYHGLKDIIDLADGKFRTLYFYGSYSL